MMTSIKLFKLTTKPPAYLDDHLLRDLGISRIDSEFAPPAPGAFVRVANARTFLDKWITRNVPETASLDKKFALQLAARCANDAGEKGISKTELEEAAGEELTDCMIDAQLAGADAKLNDLFD